jgi:hypothetical protein
MQKAAVMIGERLAELAARDDTVVTVFHAAESQRRQRRGTPAKGPLVSESGS